MNVSRTRQLTVNMGNYGERYQAGATATVSHADLGYTDEEAREHDPGELLEELTDFALQAVNSQLESELAEAMAIRDDEEPSFTDRYQHPETARPRKRKRSR